MPTFKSPIDPTDTHGYAIIAIGWEDNYFENIVCNLERAFLVQLFQFSNVLSTLSKVD
jgi:hypothetical protein